MYATNTTLTVPLISDPPPLPPGSSESFLVALFPLLRPPHQTIPHPEPVVSAS